MHTKVSLNVRHRVVSPARIAERTASLEIRPQTLAHERVTRRLPTLDCGSTACATSSRKLSLTKPVWVWPTERHQRTDKRFFAFMNFHVAVRDGVRHMRGAFDRRCCTALAESEIRLWWWPRYVSSMKYPKRCQYKHAKQKKYHVRNWAEYNEGLRRRGDLTVWFDEEAIANWKADKTGKPGGQRVYSDMAIETGLVVRMVYKLAYRQTEGFLHSIASLLGLGIEIPDYSTLCRRSRLLRKKLRIPKAASTQPIHLMIDSTGLRIHVGNARKPPKQRAWRKLHIAVDRETGNIVASELTASRARDATRVPALLTQIQAPLVSVAADSAYDKEAVYEAIEAHSPGRRTRVVIPPQRNATLSQNSNTAMQERDRHIRAIERHGRREWYKLSGYTKRSMVENAVYRYKAIIGPEMRARTLARQRVEHRIGCEILNKMAALGMPDTYCAG